MTDELFERYKESLREGHVAALQGDLERARTAYERAATIAPDRSLPLASLASVLRRLGRDADALRAYERALERVPGDADALGGRAACLAALGRTEPAADAFAALAEAHAHDGHLDDAIAAAERAVLLADSAGRRERVAALTAMRDERNAERAAAPPPTGRVPAPAVVEAPDDAERRADERAATIGPLLSVAAGPVDDPAAAPLTDDDARALDARIAAAEVRLDAGDAPGAVAAYLDAAVALRDARRWRSALDACSDALRLAPADGRSHLDLAELYLDVGWQALAAAKVRLVAALADLDGDTETRARARQLALDRLPDDPSLAAVRA